MRSFLGTRNVLPAFKTPVSCYTHRHTWKWSGNPSRQVYGTGRVPGPEVSPFIVPHRPHSQPPEIKANTKIGTFDCITAPALFQRGRMALFQRRGIMGRGHFTQQAPWLPKCVFGSNLSAMSTAGQRFTVPWCQSKVYLHVYCDCEAEASSSPSLSLSPCLLTRGR